MEQSGEFMSPNLEKEISPKNFSVHEIKDFDKFLDICSVGDSDVVETDQYLSIENNENIVVASYGAGPCVSGILQTNNNKIYMFHDYANSLLTKEQEEIIKNTQKGIIGSGDIESLTEFRSKLNNNKNIKMIPPPGEDSTFNIAFVKKKNKFKVSPGFYFCYN